jgi:arylformamidase
MDWLMELDSLVRGGRIIDLSPTIEHNMPKWPTHPQIIVDPTITHEHDGYYCQTLVMGEHTGAHVDCPAHILPDMMEHTVDTYAPDMIIGPAIKYDLYKFEAKPGERITRAQILELEEKMGDRAQEGDIVLLDFNYQQYWKLDSNWKYYGMNEPGLDEGACELFAERKVRAVGSDTVACDTPVENGNEHYSYGHHKSFLPNHIFIMEMLMNLSELPRRSYFVAVPLKIKNGSGSPIRPFAIVEKD